MSEIIEKKDELSLAVRAYLRTGDLAMLPDSEKDKVLLKMCEHYSLDPVLRPFILIKLNGKEVWYPTKAATDQVAAKFNLTREVIEIKENIERGILECRVKITQENSNRIETCVAAVSIMEFARNQATGKVEPQPMRGEAYANALMKVETKAKRRATLGWLGIADMQDPGEESMPESKSVTAEAALSLAPGSAVENKTNEEKKRGPGRPSRAEIEARAMGEQKIHLSEQMDSLEKIKPQEEKIEKATVIPEIPKELPTEFPLAPKTEIGKAFAESIKYSRENENHKHLMKITLDTLGIDWKNAEQIKIASKVSIACNGMAPIMDKDNQFLKGEFTSFVDSELKKARGISDIDAL